MPITSPDVRAVQRGHGPRRRCRRRRRPLGHRADLLAPTSASQLSRTRSVTFNAATTAPPAEPSPDPHPSERASSPPSRSTPAAGPHGSAELKPANPIVWAKPSKRGTVTSTFTRHCGSRARGVCQVNGRVLGQDEGAATAMRAATVLPRSRVARDDPEGG